jgi:putative flippase GtrA
MINIYNMIFPRKKLLFIVISGIGWIIDFGIYTLLTSIIRLSVIYSNIISAVPAVTFVFIFSTRKIFKNSVKRITLKEKYILFLIYQVILVTTISIFAEYLYNNMKASNVLDINNLDFIYQNLKLTVKLMITPITLLCNFIFMKVLVEKL